MRGVGTHQKFTLITYDDQMFDIYQLVRKFYTLHGLFIVFGAACVLVTSWPIFGVACRLLANVIFACKGPIG